MDLRQLRYVVAVAECGSFRRAAERLRMAQPPLSMSIRKLEAELGTRLFERGRYGARLTATGEAVLNEARLTLHHAERTRSVAAAVRAGEIGRVRLAFVGSAAYALLPRTLPAFRQAFPKVHLELQESTTAEVIAMIDDGAIDAGIVRYPLPRATRLNVVHVEQDVLVAVLPAGHPLAKRRSIDLAELADDPFVFYSEKHVPGLHLVSMLACQEAGFTPRVAQEAVQVQTVLSLVETGLGVALVPSVSERIASTRVALRSLTGSSSRLNIGLALVHRRGPEATHIQHLRDIMQGRST